jgi:ParB-like chromosome segregation protein Spo0J/DNA-binding CsgD family transcriptional regulator
MATPTGGETAEAVLADVDSIKVDGRHRKEYGDIDGLAASIADVGLLEPILVNTDLRLIAGERRLLAHRKLGRDVIACRKVATLDDAAAALRAERDENVQRLAMPASVLATLGEALETLERPRAAQAQRDSGGDVRRRERFPSTEGNRDNQTSARVSKALGISRTSYERISRVRRDAENSSLPADQQDAAAAALDEMDRTGTVTPPHDNYARYCRERREPNESPPRPTNRKDAASVRYRAESIRRLASSGHAAAQIARELDLSEEGVKNICKRDGIDLPADRMLARTRRGFDSNEFIEQTVIASTPTPDLMAMVDFTALNTERIDEWIRSLQESVKALRSLIKALQREQNREQL